MLKISACILTYNEEHNISELLDQLSFCDEIVVLDHFSTDRTPEMARRYTNVRFFQEPFQGFCKQKNRLLELSKNDWVLCLDADERLDDDAMTWIRNIDLSGNQKVFKLARKCFYLGKWIRYGGWYPDWQIRLFDKRVARWSGGETHEYVETQEKEGILSGNILHYSFRDIHQQLEKNNFYSSRLATGLSASIGKMVVRPGVTFLRMYVLQRGFLDGIPGLIVAVHSAASTFAKYAKAWEILQKKRLIR